MKLIASTLILVVLALASSAQAASTPFGFQPDAPDQRCPLVLEQNLLNSLEQQENVLEDGLSDGEAVEAGIGYPMVPNDVASGSLELDSSGLLPTVLDEEDLEATAFFIAPVRPTDEEGHGPDLKYGEGLWQFTIGESTGNFVIEVGLIDADCEYTSKSVPTVVISNLEAIKRAVADQSLGDQTVAETGDEAVSGASEAWVGIVSPVLAGTDYENLGLDDNVVSSSLLNIYIAVTGFEFTSTESPAVKITALPSIKITPGTVPVGPVPVPTFTPSYESKTTISGASIQSSAILGDDPGFPVPGPASILVMALGALAVLGRVWMARRAI